MPERIRLRRLATEEVSEVGRLATSRKEPVCLVQRAQIIAAMVDDPNLTVSTAALGAGYESDTTGPMWVKRFNEEGLARFAGAASLRAETDP